MWISSCKAEVDLDTLEWTTDEGREVRWMLESDMTQVGITSGVKKILKAVKDQNGKHEKKKRKR